MRSQNLSVLQIREVNRDNLGINIHISPLKHIDPSLAPSRRAGSNAGSQQMFSLKIRIINFELSSIPLLSGALTYVEPK